MPRSLSRASAPPDDDRGSRRERDGNRDSYHDKDDRGRRNDRDHDHSEHKRRHGSQSRHREHSRREPQLQLDNNPGYNGFGGQVRTPAFTQFDGMGGGPSFAPQGYHPAPTYFGAPAAAPLLYPSAYGPPPPYNNGQADELNRLRSEVARLEREREEALRMAGREERLRREAVRAFDLQERIHRAVHAPSMPDEDVVMQDAAASSSDSARLEMQYGDTVSRSSHSSTSRRPSGKPAAKPAAPQTPHSSAPEAGPSRSRSAPSTSAQGGRVQGIKYTKNFNKKPYERSINGGKMRERTDTKEPTRYFLTAGPLPTDTSLITAVIRQAGFERNDMAVFRLMQWWSDAHRKPDDQRLPEENFLLDSWSKSLRPAWYKTERHSRHAQKYHVLKSGRVPSVEQPIDDWNTYYTHHSKIECKGVPRTADGTLDAAILEGHLLTLRMVCSGQPARDMKRELVLNALAPIFRTPEAYDAVMAKYQASVEADFAFQISPYEGPLPPSEEALVQHIVKCGIMRGDVVMSFMAWAQYRCEAFIVSPADAAIAVQPAGVTAEAEAPGVLVSGPSTATDQSANADVPSNGLAIPSSRTLPDDRMEVEYTPGTSVASA
ncbi:hypothetical protein C8Q76DRAFT_790171 [Earliella scabrosa]|nr:hypothetical protein C8Q76DRAFT_790171 [Earliella scabrosa]